jgi:Fur family peroxide stress response transcriptional regulator
LRVTSQRAAVYEVLEKSTQHPAVETVFQEVRKVLPNISLDTVNRTLLTFQRVGLAFVVEGSGYPKRFDANFKNHQHFRCVKCRRIIDFHDKKFDNIKLPPSLAKKFKILKKTVYVEGICDECLD